MSATLTPLRNAPSYIGLSPASPSASRAARASSKKSGTSCEVVLRHALAQVGLWSSTRSDRIRGKPDLVFRRARVVVFCDGDYWHGRNLEQRLEKLASGHNAAYWVRKIESNVARDRRVTAELDGDGWVVLRYWETDIHKATAEIANAIADVVKKRLSRT